MTEEEGEERKVFLIPYSPAVRIKDIPDDFVGDAYSTVLVFGGPVLEAA